MPIPGFLPGRAIRSRPLRRCRRDGQSAPIRAAHVRPTIGRCDLTFGCRAGDAATTELLRRVNAEGRVLLSSTRVGGRVVGRICVLNHRTDRAHVDEALDALRRHAG